MDWGGKVWLLANLVLGCVKGNKSRLLRSVLTVEIIQSRCVVIVGVKKVGKAVEEIGRVGGEDVGSVLENSVEKFKFLTHKKSTTIITQPTTSSTPHHRSHTPSHTAPAP